MAMGGTALAACGFGSRLSRIDCRIRWANVAPVSVCFSNRVYGNDGGGKDESQKRQKYNQVVHLLLLARRLHAAKRYSNELEIIKILLISYLRAVSAMGLVP
jgi:hypothetical protein